MFAGIIEEIGTVSEIGKKGNSFLLGIEAKKVFDDLSIGDSISVDGVCLTVENIKFPVFYASLSPETLRTTTLGSVKMHAPVNLERALKYGERAGGHLLSGHIDFKTPIVSRENRQNYSIILLKVPAEYSSCFVKKGSVGIDGISLTVADMINGHIAIWLIPYTIENTTIKNKKIGDQVNVEVDMLAKIALGTKTSGRRTHGKIIKETIF
ncbi:MAG: riboflavin synthase [Candidatus Omnitrophica bacterium]|nr:riboflavin synthase [Candidatus Omnitrophota bacterium]MCM8788541.1 riboflavin synthase [Candidatus Omnitrophota bacterium]